MRKLFPFIACSLLLPMGWANALAQESPTVTPAQRLNLELVNNVSRYNIDTQQNEYTNTFRLTQPTTDYKLTAGLLKQGDNYITVTRQGVKDGETVGDPTDFARINLNTAIASREAVILTDIEFSSTTPPSPWTGNNALQAGTNGYRIRSGYSISYTIPDGYDDGIILLNIGTYSAGYLKINGTTTSSQTTAGQWNQYVLSGLNSGSTITIQGSTRTGGNSASPYMLGIYIVWAPKTIIPTYTVIPTYSKKDGDNWVNVSTLSSQTYNPNDDINANSLSADIVDEFAESTANNSHPTSYNYSANLDANIDWSVMTGDFYASVDFTKGNGSDLESPEFIGPDGWGYLLVSYYTPSGATPAFYLDATGELIYTMPPTFTGNTVNVTVTSTNHSDGAGILVVNGTSHTFTQGSSYTYVIPASANGVIQFKSAEGESYTCDIAKIVIQSGNGTAMHAPLSQPNKHSLKKLNLNGKEINLQKRESSSDYKQVKR